MELSQQEISLFINALKSCTEYDFSEYSIKSFTRRVEKLVTDNNLKITELIEKIRSNDEFLEKVVRDITVNTTELFRDPEIWRTIRTEIIPRYKDEPEINVWHAGCSTGQEIFSFLILINEFGLFNKTNVFASDLNSEVIEIAQSGKYKYREIDEYINNYTNAFLDTKMPPMANYIDISRAKSLIKIRAELTKKPIFKKHDLISVENPFNKKFHVIFCRNVLIYFNHELQNRIFEFFYNNMHPKGTLIIGRHEGILGEISTKFDKFGTIYVKK